MQVLLPILVGQTRAIMEELASPLLTSQVATTACVEPTTLESLVNVRIRDVTRSLYHFPSVEASATYPRNLINLHTSELFSVRPKARSNCVKLSLFTFSWSRRPMCNV